MKKYFNIFLGCILVVLFTVIVVFNEISEIYQGKIYTDLSSESIEMTMSLNETQNNISEAIMKDALKYKEIGVQFANQRDKYIIYFLVILLFKLTFVVVTHLIKKQKVKKQKQI